MSYNFRLFVLSFFCFTGAFAQTKKFVINDFTIDTSSTIAYQSIYMNDKSIVVLANSYIVPTSTHILKIDSTGNIIWSKSIFSQDPRPTIFTSQFIKTLDNGFLISGQAASRNTPDNNATIIKLDSTGNLQWATEIGDTNVQKAFSATQLSDSSYVIAGSTGIFTVSENVLIAKLDKNGNVLWTKTCNRGITGNKVIATHDGGYAICTQSTCIKFDQYDSLQWIRSIQSSNQKFLFDLIQTSDGGYVFGGIDLKPQNENDNVVLKLDSNGLPVWIYFVDISNNDGVHTIVETADHGLLVCADTSFFLISSTTTVGSSYIFKLGYTGNFLWGSILLDSVIGKSAIELPGNKILVTGQTHAYGTRPNGSQMFFVVTDSVGGNCSDQMPIGHWFADPNLAAPLYVTATISPENLPSNFFGVVVDNVCSLTIICEDFANQTETIFNDSNDKLNVYPNPSSGIIHFQISNVSDHINHLEIFDVTGRIIYSQYEVSDRIDVSLTQNGFYFYNLKTVEGNSFVGKLIKE